MTLITLEDERDASSRRWQHSFIYHLDLLVPVMDAIVTETLPHIPVSRGGSRFDRPQIDGGGVDPTDVMLAAFDQNATGVHAGGATADARALWWTVVDYTRAVAEWITSTRPAPYLSEKPDADPLTARGIALTTAGWLIDHADQIEAVTELGEAREHLFAEIRRLRGRYGVHAHPRQPRARCTTCGENAVTVTWVNDPNGSPKPIRIARCNRCGETYREDRP